jgi:hypothetical protein
MAELHSVTTAELKSLFAMVNRIKYSPVADIADIEVAVPVLCIDHFVHAHILHEEPDHSISMLYHRKAIWLPNLALCIIFL